MIKHKDIKEKYTAFRVNFIEVQARTELGDWKLLANWKGEGVVSARTMKELKKELTRYLTMVGKL